jgi:hypothetical protein
MMRFACPHCKATVSAPEEKVGARVYCPRCRQPFHVPSATPSGSAPSLATSSSPSKPTVLPTPPSLPPLPTGPSPVPPTVSRPPDAPVTRTSHSLLAFAAGLLIGALLGGGMVWVILAREWGHWH